MSETLTHDRNGPGAAHICYACRDNGHDWPGDGTACACCGHPYPAVWVWADKVAPLLEDGPWQAEHDQLHGARFARADGVRLWVSLGTYGSYKDRVSVTGAVPEGASYSEGDYGRGDEKRPEVSVGLGRPVETVARDISRRLIPAAVAYWQATAERVARRTVAKDSREVLARELAEIMGGNAREGHRDGWQADLPHWFLGYGQLIPDYDAGKVTAEIRSMSAEQGRELARLIRSWGDR